MSLHDAQTCMKTCMTDLYEGQSDGGNFSTEAPCPQLPVPRCQVDLTKNPNPNHHRDRNEICTLTSHALSSVKDDLQKDPLGAFVPLDDPIFTDLNALP